MNEIWCVINRYPKYSVSNKGRIKNNITNRVLKPRPDNKGYMRVCLYETEGGHCKDLLIHRLVAEAFCIGARDDLDVNHIDGRKSNNFPENLEWCTRSYNLKHSYRTGLRDSPHNRCKRVRIVETGEVFNSVRECARFLGCEHSTISQCLNGYLKTCKGYHFEFCI